MPTAESTITFPSACVILASLEIHFHSVKGLQVSFARFSIHLIHISDEFFYNLAPAPSPEVIDPCRPSPCGINAVCQNRNNAAACTCLPELFGDPYIECKPECSTNPECTDNKACLRNKCADPCPGVCGSFASCRTQRHQPTCTCDPGYTGDPFRFCSRITTCKFALFN